MKTIVCEKCGANIEVKRGTIMQKCQFCGAELFLDTGKNSSEKLIENANILLESKDYEKALKLFEKSIEEEPSNYLGWLGKAKAISKNFSNITQNNIKQLTELTNTAKKVASDKERKLIEKELTLFYENKKLLEKLEKNINNSNLFFKITVAIFVVVAAIYCIYNSVSIINYQNMRTFAKVLEILLNVLIVSVSSFLMFIIFLFTFAKWFNPTTKTKQILYIIFNIIFAFVALLISNLPYL